MEASSNYHMIAFSIPKDPEILKTLGAITLRHGHLDHILRMTIKSLGRVDVQQALDATAFQGSSALRERIRKLAKSSLGEGNALLQLQALLERCRRATEKRNDLIHNIWARELDGDTQMRTKDHSWKPIPTIDELEKLSRELELLTNELNTARLEGFLFEAITAKK
ncbi:MAG: hypothetical protein Q7J84_02945 [Sulfuricaulis sp.]|nr:hypothetical protein [Sulfuricaulis sp.]